MKFLSYVAGKSQQAPQEQAKYTVVIAVNSAVFSSLTQH